MQRDRFFYSPAERPMGMGSNNEMTLSMINSLFSLCDMLTRVVVCNARLHLPSYVLKTFSKPEHLMRLFANQQEELGVTFWSALWHFILRVRQHEDVRTHDVLYLGADLVLSPHFQNKEDLLLSYMTTLRTFTGTSRGDSRRQHKNVLSEAHIYLEKRIEEVLRRIEQQEQGMIPLPSHSYSSMVMPLPE